ncbi:guanitoxin biosynthesis pre-guanitoxin forming N-methyltransferase GntF [Beggiatoa leptomitoformis]|uniref:Methyltransferase domain-containing protein n=1 Tax=Beggiatoa leptomitoformis TaxID=288004 RepID=A0A2N9YB27_9GAMM|nr:guanitoxin biosynthesis pre-guanitoxin forming N-methyltransferase GntF [Beggiatoa leptomitoformis]ALG66957.1 methyltransferase domain-containing protein [Beggiatoa leptomitoformis]AUI67673.1 methyltransferase domain-containing protein [Beggiatoa leptomitoformis]
MTDAVLKDYQQFDVRNYLNEYFLTTDGVNDRCSRFLARCVQEQDLSNAQVLDFACGPIISSILHIATVCKEIDMCDFVPANLEEIRTWTAGDTDAFNWDSFVIKALQDEKALAGIPDADITAEEIAQRNTLVRQKIGQLLHCDGKQKYPLGIDFKKRYDVLIMSFCLENIAESVDEFENIFTNTLELLKPNGLLIWFVLAQRKDYKVGELTYHSLVVSPTIVEQQLTRDNRYQKLEFIVEHIGEDGSLSDSVLVLCSARKLTTPKH